MKHASRLGVLAASVALALALPSFAYATADDQKEMATEDEIRMAEEAGLIETSPYQAEESDATTFAHNNYSIKSYAGETPYDTAAEIATSAHPSSDWVIIASGNSFVDTLTSSSLAGALKCPILLTDVQYLPEVTAHALESIGARNIIITGGQAVVSENVENALAAYGTVTRLFGETQYDTQLALYEFGMNQGLWNTGSIIVATGSTLETCAGDALSISPLAYKEAIPIFLMDSTGSIPEQTAPVLSGNTTVTEAIVVGGPVVVSEESFTTVDGICRANGGAAMRVAGQTSYDTSEAVARWTTNNDRLTWEHAAFSTGMKPYDALAGSALQGTLGSVLLLADKDMQQNMELLSSQAPSSYSYLGGQYWFPNYLKAGYALNQGRSLNDIEGFIVYLDAGHGFDGMGNGILDPGAGGCGYWESDLTTELASKVASVLRNEYGMAVYVNNDGYYKYRQAEAANLNCGAFVSMHFNAGGGSGSESYIHTYRAASGSDVLQRRVHWGLVSSLRLYDRGMLQEQFAVCGGNVPAVLLEVAYIDNWSDMNTYRSRIDSVAHGIAASIAE